MSRAEELDEEPSRHSPRGEVLRYGVRKAIDGIARATPDNKPSMLQDLERGNRTEIDAINGALVARAQRLGLPARLNDLLTRLVRNSGRSRRTPRLRSNRGL